MRLWGLPPQALARELLANTAMKVPAIRRRRLKGMRTRAESPQFEARKIVAEFDFMRDSAPDIAGRTIVEIGPGDAIGLAPLFISAGASRYVAVDRFLGDIWGPQAAVLYDEIEKLWGPFRANWREQVGLVSHSIEQGAEAIPKADLIVSFDVVEHLIDVRRAVRNMSAVLKPDGRMVHRVDYGPHGVWLTTKDPLAFLSVPEWLWDAIGSSRGYPNRVRHEEFVRLLQARGLHVTQRVTRVQGTDVMDAELVCAFQFAPQLGQPFRQDP
jgi:SAM-dependent methyltransferase